MFGPRRLFAMITNDFVRLKNYKWKSAVGRLMCSRLFNL